MLYPAAGVLLDVVVAEVADVAAGAWPAGLSARRAVLWQHFHGRVRD